MPKNGRFYCVKRKNRMNRLGTLARSKGLRLLDRMKVKFTAIVRPEEGVYVAFNPELDIASQGESRSAAVQNLQEAVNLFLQSADPSEIEGRLSEESWITQFEADYASA